MDSSDLRAYLIVLWRWKWLVVISVVLAVVGAVIVVYPAPLQYESSAVVVLAKPMYDLEFDPRIQSQDSAPWPSRWYTVGPIYRLLAKDPSLAQQIVDALGESLPSEDRDASALNEHLDVREVSVEGAVQLVVKHSDPETARLIADTWARLYTDRLNRLYGQTAQDLTTMAAQLKAARKDLDAAQIELVQFLQRSRLSALEKQLTVRQSTLGTCLRIQDHLDLVVEDAQALRTRIQKGTVPSLGYPAQLAILYLELETLGAQNSPAGGFSTGATGSPPLTLQVSLDPDALAGTSPADQVRYLDELIAAARAKKTALDARATQLESEIASLQSEIEMETVALNQLTLTRDVAYSVVSSLTRKSKEVQVSMDLDSEMARVAGPAIRAQDPVPSGKLLQVGLAAVVGLFLGVCSAFLLEFIDAWPRDRGDES